MRVSNHSSRHSRRKQNSVPFDFQVLEVRRLMAVNAMPLPDFGWTPSDSVVPAVVRQIDNSDSSDRSEPRSVQRIVNGEQTSDYDAVGYVGPFGCTGTLISPTHVLTAAHCLEGVGNRQASFEVNGQTYRSIRVTIHPDYNPNDFEAGNDIAIIELARPVSGIQPMNIMRATPQVGQMLTLVGFGEGGTSRDGYDPDDTGKQVGQTELEFVTAEHIAWNFDSHNEANTAPGDSGGPAFIDVNGQLLIAGVTSGGTGDAHRLGDYSFDTRVDVHANWIDSVVGDDNSGGGGGGGSDDHVDRPGPNATPVVLNGNGFGSSTGVIESTGDRDAFAFTVDASGQTTISLVADNTNQLDTYLRIYDQTGALIAQNDDWGQSLNSKVRLNLGTGNYFATAAAYADSETGSYSIRVKHQSDNGAYQVFTNNSRKTISHNSTDRIWSPIRVSGLRGDIADINVKVDIDHTWVSDLRLVLVGPDGTRIQLANRVGGEGDDFSGTVFDQQAGTNIRKGDAPFTGSFRPQKSLNQLNNKNPNGVWRLVVHDFEPWDGGALKSWSLEIKTDSTGRKADIHQREAESRLQFLADRRFDSVRGSEIRANGFSGRQPIAQSIRPSQLAGSTDRLSDRPTSQSDEAFAQFRNDVAREFTNLIAEHFSTLDELFAGDCLIP